MKKTAQLIFNPPLDELLTARPRTSTQTIEFQGRQTIKHLVESLGIPHTEVGALTSSLGPVDFDYLVPHGDQINILSATVERDHLSGMCVDGHLVIPARFILDNHLGKLASDLRMLGFDADYAIDSQDDQLAEMAGTENRILLTRDRQLLMRRTIRFGYLVRSLDPDQQLQETLERFNLYPQIRIFQRCMRCNHLLEKVEKDQIEGQLLPLTRKYFFKFKICPNCGRIFWSGSHVERMRNRLENILPAGSFPG